MSKRIAIVASEQPVRDYLAELVTRAGQAVTDDMEAAEAAVVFGDGRAVPVPALYLGAATPPDPPAPATQLEAPGRAATVIAAIRQMAATLDGQKQRLAIGGNVLDLFESSWIRPGGEAIRLTEKECRILHYLYDNGGGVSKSELLSAVWAYVDGVETHTLETHIYRLRKKIEDDPSTPSLLLTDGAGYSLAGL